METINELVQKYGREKVIEAAEYLLSNRKCRHVIGIMQTPDGVRLAGENDEDDILMRAYGGTTFHYCPKCGQRL